jgi:hypothetical protein
LEERRLVEIISTQGYDRSKLKRGQKRRALPSRWNLDALFLTVRARDLFDHRLRG